MATEIEWPALTDVERADLDDFCAVQDDAADLDPDAAGYAGLTPDHRLCNCGTCGRLLLAATLPGEPARGFRVRGSDRLPPLVFRWRVRRGGRVAECAGCYVAERRAAREHTGGRSGWPR